MKLVFRNLGVKKINKTVDMVIPGGVSFHAVGFHDVLDFICSEAAPHMPDDEGSIEAIPTDGLPDLMAHHYVIVYNGLISMGTVSIFHI